MFPRGLYRHRSRVWPVRGARCRPVLHTQRSSVPRGSGALGLAVEGGFGILVPWSVCAAVAPAGHAAAFPARVVLSVRFRAVVSGSAQSWWTGGLRRLVLWKAVSGCPCHLHERCPRSLVAEGWDLDSDPLVYRTGGLHGPALWKRFRTDFLICVTRGSAVSASGRFERDLASARRGSLQWGGRRWVPCARLALSGVGLCGHRVWALSRLSVSGRPCSPGRGSTFLTRILSPHTVRSRGSGFRVLLTSTWPGVAGAGFRLAVPAV